MTTPLITSVTGTISTGQSLIVGGTNLMAEVRTNYDSWFTTTRSGFEGANVGADNWDTNQSSPALIYDTTVKLKGSKSMRMLMTGVHLWPEGDGVPWGWLVATANSPWSSGQPKDVYIRGYVRWNYFDSVTGAISWPRNVPASGNPNPSKKLWWADNPGITGWSLQFNMNNDGSPPSAWHVELTTRITGADVSTQLGSFPGGALQNNKWYCFEYHYVKANSGGPYVVEGWVDGVLTASVSAVAGFDPSNTGSIMSKVNEWNTNSTWQGYEWCDELAVSTSRIRPLCVVEIGDSATYASAHPKYQYPEYFTSDSSIQVTCDLTGLTGPNYWMWVTDSSGTRSVTGFILTGGPDTTAPVLSSASAGTPSPVGTVGASVSTNEGNGTLYWTTYTDGSLPSDSDVKNHTGTGAQSSSSYGSSTVLATGTQVFGPIVGLGSSTNFDIYSVQEDLAGNLSTKIKADLLTLAVDTTAPILSSPNAGTPTASGTFGHSVTTDEGNGNLYWVVLSAGGSCTDAQLKLGTGGNILDGFAWSKTVTASGVQSVSPNTIAGLSASTIYKINWLQTDAAGNDSAQASVNLTTLAANPTTLFFSEPFDNASFASRGWFDVTTGTIDTSVFSPSGGAASLNIHWGIGTTAPTAPRRHAIPATDSVYMKFYVKFGTSTVTWQGSGHTYHPHIFQILTDSDDEWIGPSQTHLSTRIETSVFKPRINFGDALRIFTTNAYPSTAGTYPHNNASPSLLGTTSDHAVWGGNGIQSGSGANFYDEGSSWDNTAEYLSAGNNFVNNTWHKVEVYFVMNTVSAGVPVADGIARYWVDGTLVIDKTNIYLRTGAYASQKFKTILLVPYIGDGSPIAQDMWIDNLEVWSGIPTEAVFSITGQGTASMAGAALVASSAFSAGAS